MMPVTVTTGISVLRKACLVMVCHSSMPLARAVRMKSWSSTSSIAERVIRARKPSWNMPSTSAGWISDAAQAPIPLVSSGA